MFIHLNELRYRLTYIFIAFLFNFAILYLYLGEMLYLITKPLTTPRNRAIRNKMFDV